MIADAAAPLPDFDDPGFGALFDRYANHRVVLLGEATHGTAEFYRARAAITRHLIARHGFGIVAVEADWPDAAAIDRHVRHRPHRAGEPPFARFPTWMWRNTDVAEFVDWLHDHNADLAPQARAAFHGLDIYNMQGSIAAVLAYLDETDPDAARIARERYGCLTPWQSDPVTYGRAVLSERYRACEDEVVAQLRAVLEKQLDHEARENPAGFLDAAQNARLVRSAERYYRIMYHGGADSWNLRDSHMFETLENVLDARGPDARAVVWAHNSHVGDARATDMGTARGEHNIGQLCRERWGDEAALIGLGTHEGTVAAATDWGGPMEVKRIRPSLEDSYERLCHDAGVPRFLLDLHRDPALRGRLEDRRLERFIGVIYRPETERQSHYTGASLARQFDAWLWFDDTRAVTPLEEGGRRGGTPQTWPFGV
jgi:erythromycin esterase-like protein